MTAKLAPAPISPAPRSGPPAAVAAAPPRSDGIRDTIESIVVAFILAFVFRAFIVEAFVIPTGSMAPGLYGKHIQHRCDLCHYPFAYGIREDAVLADGRVSPGTLRRDTKIQVRCPNCGWANGKNENLNSTADPLVADSGDRILVLKWCYDIGGALLGPKRWDVVVFKDPNDGDTNFIKRLIGLPGEVLEIINGDIYTAPVSSLPEDIVEALAQPPVPGNKSARRLNPAQEKQLAKTLRIRRKTRIAQNSLWMIHYDHDFKPDLARGGAVFNFVPPVWRPQDNESAKCWSAAAPVIRFTPKSPHEHWLRLEGKPIQDNYGYNDVLFPSSPAMGGVDVGDVRFRFVLVPAGEKGHFVLRLAKGSDDFRARIAADGSILLDRAGEGGVRIVLAKATIAPLQVDKPLRVEFENLDYRVTLRINDEEIVATNDSQYSPPIETLLEQPYQDGRLSKASISIGAQDLALDIRHLVVERDVFYRSDCRLEEMNPYTRKTDPFGGWPGWGTAHNPILLRDNPPEFFCCGDNSPQSKDSRLWWEVCPMLADRGNYQFGTVPADQMIGRAFFVYWPSGYRFTKDSPPVIPNVGRMRIIR